jgi:hypothetical protein
LENGPSREILEVLASLQQNESTPENVDPHLDSTQDPIDNPFTADLRETDGAETQGMVHAISASGMFGLDDLPGVADADKLQYVLAAMDGREGLSNDGKGVSVADIQVGPAMEPYILISRGEEFADSFDTWFFAKTFPTLFPFGGGGPRQAEEATMDAGHGGVESATSSRNMTLANVGQDRLAASWWPFCHPSCVVFSGF